MQSEPSLANHIRGRTKAVPHYTYLPQYPGDNDIGYCTAAEVHWGLFSKEEKEKLVQPPKQLQSGQTQALPDSSFPCFRQQPPNYPTLLSLH